MTARLYTPQVLALATSLAAYPLDEAMPLRGTARSLTCGSVLTLGAACDEQGWIAALGLRVQACAIGQAAAAIFAAGADGRSRGDIAATLAALEAWLGGEGPMPAWPQLDLIAAAHGYPARHGALLLPWKAALSALSTA